MKVFDSHNSKEVPARIRSAVLQIEWWAKENGWREWKILGVASRVYCEDLEHELELLKIQYHR
jgi:hypothetical protein